MSNEQIPEIKFNREKAITSSVTSSGSSKVEENTCDFLSEALDISERFINTPRFQNAIKNNYHLTPIEFREKLQQVAIKFAKWNDGKENKSDEIVLSWIDRCNPKSIYMNEIFWERYCDTTDHMEKKRILFISSLSIIHELGHLCVQWSTHPKFKIETNKEGQTYKITPPSMREAGLFLEKMLVGFTIAVIIQEKNKKNWSRRSKITEVALYYGHDEFGKIDDDFICQVLESKIIKEELFEFAQEPITIAEGHVALERGQFDYQHVTWTVSDTPWCIIPLCGTKLLNP